MRFYVHVLLLALLAAGQHALAVLQVLEKHPFVDRVVRLEENAFAVLAPLLPLADVPRPVDVDVVPLPVELILLPINITIEGNRTSPRYNIRRSPGTNSPSLDAGCSPIALRIGPRLPKSLGGIRSLFASFATTSAARFGKLLATSYRLFGIDCIVNSPLFNISD